jgi:hypothetical protein
VILELWQGKFIKECFTLFFLRVSEGTLSTAVVAIELLAVLVKGPFFVSEDCIL